jgi:tetratricopeptide (TPR) repeat protein
LKKAELLTFAYKKTSDNNYLRQTITVYESLLPKMPNNISVLNNLAYMLAENNERLPEALQYARQAYKANPSNPSFLDTYAYVLYKNGEYSQAVEMLTAAIQQYEQSNVIAPAELYEHLGMVKEKVGEKKQAVDAYQQALKIGQEQLSEKNKKKIEEAIGRLSR